MIATTVIAALALPADARVDRWVPKKLLVDNGSPTAIDKRQINEGIEEILWLAALKPATIGVSAYCDDAREYLEIAVLLLTLRTGAKVSRLMELVHRAIPYPVVLITAHDGTVTLSLAHKRWSQGETGKIVIEKICATTPFKPDTPTAVESLFLASLALSEISNRDLFALYQGWLDRVATLEAAQITGAFAPPNSASRASTLRDGLDNHARLQHDIAVLRAQAKKEKQLNRRVELNLKIKRLEAELTVTAKAL